VLFFGVLVACGYGQHQAPQVTPPTSSAPPTKAAALPQGFDLQKYSTYDSAEAAVGYHILRTSAYALQWNEIFVQAVPTTGQPKTSEIFALPGGNSIYLDMIPGVSVPSSGARINLGNRNLTLVDQDNEFRQLEFACGERATTPVGCSIRVHDVSDEQLAEFLRTLN
jgi:hypothetical protein